MGCGDIGMRVADQLSPRVRLLALTSNATRAPQLRAHGVTPLNGNLDAPRTLRRLAGLATRVVHLAPPPANGWADTRTQSLAQALRMRARPRSVVYGSTTGVYGDCGGEWVAETRAVRAHSPRAQRRVDAEARMRFWGRGSGARVSILRIPGIYATNRAGGTPRERLLKGIPVLRDEDDV